MKKGPVVLYFYPKSFTSVCTVEAHEFAENIENFAAAGASVIGISGDKIEVQRDFSTKECRDKFLVGAEASAAERAPCWPREVDPLVTLNALALKPEF